MATGLAAPTPQQFFLDSGAVNALGTVETYLVGTSTPVATFSDYNLATPNATTVDLNAAGRPDSGGIYLDSTIAYTFIEKDVNGATVKTYNIAALFNGPFTIAGNATISGTLGVTGAVTVGSTIEKASGARVTFAAALLTSSKNIAINTAVVTGAGSASDLLLPNQGAVRGSNAAGTSQLAIAYIDTSDRVQLDVAGNGVKAGAFVDAVTGFKFNGTAGVATFGPSAVTSITIKGGIVTSVS